MNMTTQNRISISHSNFITLVFIVGLFCIGIPRSEAQVFKGQAIAGINFAQVDGDEVYGYKKYLPNLGLGVMMPFGNNWDISLETTFSQKGAKGIPSRIIEEYDNYDLRLDYVEVPVLIHYTDKDFITAGLGFAWGRLVGLKELEALYDVETEDWNWTNTEIGINDNVFKKDDFSVLIDLRLPIYQRLKFNFRFQYSMAQFREREYTNMAGNTRTRYYYNNILSFRLIYMFNEDLSNVRPGN